MANVLSIDKKIAVIGTLAEGSSIRSIERITGVHRDTVEVFDLHDHPNTYRFYEWSHETNNPDDPTRHVALLHIPPVVSPYSRKSGNPPGV